MAETVTPTPAPTATTTPSKADVRKRKTLVDEFKTALSDAQSEVSKAFADVKSVVDAGDTPNLTPLMGAVDDLTAAVGDITAHGARNSHLSNEDSKKIRDAQNALTQAFSDLRTALEFPSMATDLAGLSTRVDNMDAAIRGIGSAKP